MAVLTIQVKQTRKLYRLNNQFLSLQTLEFALPVPLRVKYEPDHELFPKFRYYRHIEMELEKFGVKG